MFTRRKNQTQLSTYTWRHEKCHQDMKLYEYGIWTALDFEVSPVFLPLLSSENPFLQWKHYEELCLKTELI